MIKQRERIYYYDRLAWRAAKHEMQDPAKVLRPLGYIKATHYIHPGIYSIRLDTYKRAYLKSADGIIFDLEAGETITLMNNAGQMCEIIQQKL